MRIAQVASLFEGVPPKYYGGRERVTASRMAQDYLEVYERVITRNQIKLLEARA